VAEAEAVPTETPNLAADLRAGIQLNMVTSEADEA
jgi:hypothetical protein